MTAAALLVAIALCGTSFVLGIVFVEHLVEPFERDADGNPTDKPAGPITSPAMLVPVVLGAVTALVLWVVVS